jgi:hypothetical protein
LKDGGRVADIGTILYFIRTGFSDDGEFVGFLKEFLIFPLDLMHSKLLHFFTFTNTLLFGPLN